MLTLIIRYGLFNEFSYQTVNYHNLKLSYYNSCKCIGFEPTHDSSWNKPFYLVEKIMSYNYSFRSSPNSFLLVCDNSLF